MPKGTREPSRKKLLKPIAGVSVVLSFALLILAGSGSASAQSTVVNSPAEVLWEDDFSGDWPDRWPLKWLGKGRERTDSFRRDGEAWLRVTFPDGSVGTGFKFATDQPPQERLYMEYSLRFDEDFDWVKGGKLPGLYGGAKNTGGKRPSGEDGWSVRFMWRKNGTGSAYVYHPDQPRKWGEDFRLDNFQFRKGVVQTLGLGVTMNTPGKGDGIIRAWLDGVLVVEETAMRFRDVPDLQIDGLLFSTFFGGNTDKWAPSKDETIEFGDFRLYTAPVPTEP